MRLPKLRELREAVKALIIGPYTSKFPKIMPEVPDGFRGLPEFHEDECVVCTACSIVCPTKCIEVIENEKKGERLMRHNYDECIFCGQCERYCITGKGIILSKRYDLATFDRKSDRSTVKDNLVVCEECGKIITTEKHLKWIAKEAGELVNSNPTLLLTIQKDIGNVDEIEKGSGIDRKGNIRILCSECRRKMVLSEVWG